MGADPGQAQLRGAIIAHPQDLALRVLGAVLAPHQADMFTMPGLSRSICLSYTSDLQAEPGGEEGTLHNLALPVLKS